MNLHQVLTGAVNPGDSCFSVGSLHDQPFTVSVPRRGRGASAGPGAESGCVRRGGRGRPPGAGLAPVAPSGGGGTARGARGSPARWGQGPAELARSGGADGGAAPAGTCGGGGPGTRGCGGGDKRLHKRQPGLARERETQRCLAARKVAEILSWAELRKTLEYPALVLLRFSERG